ncbi:unnamed protein product, partial [Adineta steineri]
RNQTDCHLYIINRILKTNPNFLRLLVFIKIFCFHCFLEPKFNKWKQNAITVAGENGYGEQLNQCSYPEGIFIDEKKSIFIADGHNHRIVEWKCNAKEGQIIAGGNGQGNRLNQLNGPTDVIIDEQNHSTIIADHGNKRV